MKLTDIPRISYGDATNRGTVSTGQTSSSLASPTLSLTPGFNLSTGDTVLVSTGIMYQAAGITSIVDNASTKGAAGNNVYSKICDVSSSLGHLEIWAAVNCPATTGHITITATFGGNSGSNKLSANCQVLGGLLAAPIDDTGVLAGATNAASTTPLSNGATRYAQSFLFTAYLGTIGNGTANLGTRVFSLIGSSGTSYSHRTAGVTLPKGWPSPAVPYGSPAAPFLTTAVTLRTQ